MNIAVFHGKEIKGFMIERRFDDILPLDTMIKGCLGFENTQFCHFSLSFGVSS